MIGWQTSAFSAMLAGLAVALALDAAGAQAPSAATVVSCEGVLTAEEATTIVGESFGAPAVDQPRPGFTRCEWQGPDSNFGFTFASLQALKDEESTPERSFESEVSAVENDDRKRESIDDVGVAAALVDLGDDALLIAVQRPDGVARMVLYKVSRDKALALARAIAAP